MTCENCIHYDVCEALEMNGLAKVPPIHCGYFNDKSRHIELPCKVGTHLWKITYPYRQEPKVTEFVVKNFKTVGKRHKIQIEVQAVNVPVTNWMYYTAFHTSKEEAEKALAERNNR